MSVYGLCPSTLDSRPLAVKFLGKHGTDRHVVLRSALKQRKIAVPVSSLQDMRSPAMSPCT